MLEAVFFGKLEQLEHEVDRQDKHDEERPQLPPDIGTAGPGRQSRASG